MSIIFIHGIDGSKKDFLSINKRLKEDSDFISYDLSSLNLNNIKNQLNENIDIIAHSFGGSIIKYILINNPEIKINNFICIASPLKFVKNTQKIHPKVLTILKGITSKEIAPNQYKSLINLIPTQKIKNSILSKESEENDGVVFFNSMKACEKFENISNSNHYNILFKKETITKIKEILSSS